MQLAHVSKNIRSEGYDFMALCLEKLCIFLDEKTTKLYGIDVERLRSVNPSLVYKQQKDIANTILALKGELRFFDFKEQRLLEILIDRVVKMLGVEVPEQTQEG